MPNLYHVTGITRLKNILSEGISPYYEPLSTEIIKKEIMEVVDMFIDNVENEENEELFQDCSAESENDLNDILQEYAPEYVIDKNIFRRDAVYFWTSLNKAHHVIYLTKQQTSISSIPQIIIEVNPLEIYKKEDCVCYKADASITDKIYDEFISSCYGNKTLDEEKIIRLAKEYWKSASIYSPHDNLEDIKYANYEIVCSCVIPVSAIVNIYNEVGNIIK